MFLMLLIFSKGAARRSDGRGVEEGVGGEVGEGLVGEPLVLEATGGLPPAGEHTSGDVDENVFGGGDAMKEKTVRHLSQRRPWKSWVPR